MTQRNGNMKRTLTALIWATVLAAAHGAEPVAARIDIYQEFFLTAVVQDARHYVWFVQAPSKADVPVVPLDGGKRLRLARGDLAEDGEYLVFLGFVGADGTVSKLYGNFFVGYGPQPDPKPDPKPEPEPDPTPPPGPVQKLWVLVVEEKTGPWREQDKQPSQYVHVSQSPKVAAWLEQNGHRIERRDRHSEESPDRTLPPLAPWFEAVGDEPLPYVFLIAEEAGKAVWHGPLPTEEAMFLELVKKWGARE
jgi:hypothetical protein